MVDQDYARAEGIYTTTMKERPADPSPIAGLIRAELGEGRLDDALALARKALAEHPKEAVIEDALGEVALRRGEPEQAIAAFDAAMRLNPCLARIHFDFSRYLDLAGMARTARRQLEFAHSLAPNDPAIDRAWKAAPAPPLTPEQNIARFRERMDALDATPEAKAGAAEAIRAIEAKQRGDCQPVGEVTSTTLKMVDLSDGPARQYAVGLDVLMNGKHKRLEIDTGASGLTISRGSAISAGLIPEAEIKTGGIGDRGPANTFVTHVDDLRIGGMQFRNCIVHVFEKRSILDVDGLIGADVFSNYLVTLDTPSSELRLASLPSRPDEAGEAKSLATYGDSGSTAVGAATKDPPHDRYIAPEKKDWTRVYRQGHALIVPTRIGNAPTKLFIMDTGASNPLISPQAAREVTHVDSNDRIRVHGINGDVKNVLQAEAVTLQLPRCSSLSAA